MHNAAPLNAALCPPTPYPAIHPPQPSAAPSLSFQPRLLLDDPARMTRLVQAAAAASAANTPRLLEGPSAATASGGSATPRLARDSVAALTLTAGSAGRGLGKKGGTAPLFTLSWLAGAAGDAGGAAAEPVDDVPTQAPAPFRQAAALSDVPSAVSDTSKGQRGAKAGRSNQAVEEGGNLVFSSAPSKAKVRARQECAMRRSSRSCLKALDIWRYVDGSSVTLEAFNHLHCATPPTATQGKKEAQARTGLSLTDAMGVFGGGKAKAGGPGRPTTAAAAGTPDLMLDGAAGGCGDATRDLVVRK
jgi:hypothetical protein